MLAKTLLAFHERHIASSEGGDVWVLEKDWEKLVELARREKKKPSCTMHGITECLVCRRDGSR